MSLAMQWQYKLTSNLQSAYGKNSTTSSSPCFRDYFFSCHSMMWILSTWWGSRMSTQIHFPEFHPHQKQVRWVPEGVHVLTTEIPADTTSIEEFRKATAKSTTSGLIMQAVMIGWPGSRKDCHPLLLDYWIHREEISGENGLLFKGHRLIITGKLHNRTL